MISVSIIYLSLVCTTIGATTSVNHHDMKNFIRSMGRSFITDKYLEAQKVEKPQSNAKSLFAQAEYSETGFLILSAAEDSSCSFPTVNYGSPINTCTAEDTFSYIVRLTQDSCVGGVIEYYTDRGCANETFVGASAMTDSDLSCRELGQPLFGATYMSVACTTYSEPRLLYDSSVTSEYVNKTTCDDAGLDNYFALKMDHCFDSGAEIGYQLRPTCEDGLVMWNLHALRTACALDPRFVLPYPDTCTLEEVLEAPTDDGNTDDDRVIFNPPPSVSTTAFPTAATVFVPYNSSTRTYCASANAPTFAPTIAPTARPTTAFPTSSKPHLVRFDAEQTVTGITLSAYMNREGFHAGILKQAIADSIIGVSPEDITQWVVTENVPDTARKTPSFLSWSSFSLRGLAEEANAIDLAYRVEVETTLGTDRVMSLLQHAVTSGAFTSRLQELALQNTAGALLSAASTSVTTVAVRKDNNSPGPASTSEIIGIAVGVSAVALVILAVITHKSCLPTF